MATHPDRRGRGACRAVGRRLGTRPRRDPGLPAGGRARRPGARAVRRRRLRDRRPVLEPDARVIRTAFTTWAFRAFGRRDDCDGTYPSCAPRSWSDRRRNRAEHPDPVLGPPCGDGRPHRGHRRGRRARRGARRAGRVDDGAQPVGSVVERAPTSPAERRDASAARGSDAVEVAATRLPARADRPRDDRRRGLPASRRPAGRPSPPHGEAEGEQRGGRQEQVDGEGSNHERLHPGRSWKVCIDTIAGGLRRGCEPPLSPRPIAVAPAGPGVRLPR